MEGNQQGKLRGERTREVKQRWTHVFIVSQKIFNILPPQAQKYFASKTFFKKSNIH